MVIAIVGGGAAGCFAAIRAKEEHTGAKVVILEKTSNPLAKVKISGGGRCNVTNGAAFHRQLLAAYPRGSKWLKKSFKVFDNHAAMRWFESRGVPLKTEPDGRVFPVSDRSSDIVQCLLTEVERLGIPLKLNTRVNTIKYTDGAWQLISGANGEVLSADKVIVATGGSPRREGLDWLEQLGHRIVEPVPSLFSFNLAPQELLDLPGLSVPQAIVRIEGTRWTHSGPLLITHWGLSGPAVLVLSSFAARDLYDRDYRFNLRVNWTGIRNFEELREHFIAMVQEAPKKHLVAVKPFHIPTRLWQYLLKRADLSVEKPWAELGKKGMNKLIDTLSHDLYQVLGKTTFKEEFVTCGGIDLRDVSPVTMQSKVCPGLFFAGEILDIDGITGGFNFQAAWTTGYIAGTN